MQTIRQRRALAQAIGTTLQKLNFRKAWKAGFRAYADSESCIHIKPRLYVSPDLPDSWTPVFGTVRKS